MNNINSDMKTLLSKYSLYCYWNCSKGYTILISGTINQIKQYKEKHNIKTDKDIRKIYGCRAYTVLYRE